MNNHQDPPSLPNSKEIIALKAKAITKAMYGCGPFFDVIETEKGFVILVDLASLKARGINLAAANSFFKALNEIAPTWGTTPIPGLK